MKNIIMVALIALLLSGCGAEIAYKRGASAQDLQAGKAACQKASNEQALNQCLEDNGWAVHQLDGDTFSDEELFATVTDAKDNRMTSVKEENSNEAIMTTTNLKSATLKPATIAQEGSEPDIEGKDKTANLIKEQAVTPSMKNVKPKPSIFDTYVIKSWWKMGGNLTLLEQNMAECNDQLGDRHRPNKKTFTYTRGFAICMRQKGWRGLIEK